MVTLLIRVTSVFMVVMVIFVTVVILTPKVTIYLPVFLSLSYAYYPAYQ